MRLRPAIAIGAGGLAVLLLAIGLWLHNAYERPGPSTAETVVIIPQGTGVADIGQRLAQAGVIHKAFLFHLLVRLSASDKALRAGEYAFPAASSLEAVITRLRAGQTVQRRITFVEGTTIATIRHQLAVAEGMTGDMPYLPPEGWLAPETYFYSYGDGREHLVNRMHDAQEKIVDTLWRSRAANLPFATREEAITLASIVEKETAIESERPRIAATFINRLRRSMRLQSDPTVIYALTDGASALDRPLTRADLATPSPYNTYLNAGLPPGAICNPGRSSIAAVLNPAKTDDLYFVADGEGGHVFSKTLDEHNRNVARWRSRQKAAPIDTGGDPLSVEPAQDKPAATVPQ